jgi:hypothetical protein
VGKESSMKGIGSLVGAGLVCLVATSANALTVSYNAGSEVTSTAGAVTFWDFDGTANTSIGTVTAALTGNIFGSNPVPSNPNNNWGSAFGTATVTVNLTNPVSYLGFTWGTPDDVNTVQVYDGSTLLDTYCAAASCTTGTGLNISQFHDTPGTGYFNISAGSGETITSLVLSSSDENFEVDNFSAIVAATPLPAALPLFATGFGALGLLSWRRKRKAQAVA